MTRADSDVVARLRAAGCVFAEQEAALLVAAAADGRELDALVSERVAGRPLEHLLGWAQFDGLRVQVADGVFVPRRRSELLVRAVAERAGRGARVVELCCGVAGIAAALAARRPDLELLAADVDPAATACAQQNLPGGRVFTGDLYDALQDGLRFDVIVANAPYVPTGEIAFMPAEARDFEARIALDGGADGLDVHRRLAAGAVGRLRPGGFVIVETSRRQAAIDVEILAAAGLRASVLTDDDLDATAVIGQSSSAPG